MTTCKNGWEKNCHCMVTLLCYEKNKTEDTNTSKQSGKKSQINNSSGQK
jgi:hypothetical protein